MTKRSRVLVAVAGGLVALVLAAGLGPGVYWHTLGWWRGEAFHERRPTSYWAGRMAPWSDSFSVTFTGNGPVHTPAWNRKKSKVDRCLARIPVPASWLGLEEPPLMDGDPRALPVLLALLDDDRPNVRADAALGLKAIGAASAASRLEQLKSDADMKVRLAAVVALSSVLREPGSQDVGQ